uniref:Uncharacterized protein n=1 Tax=Ditylenchus dipsaci TaxID=166011 RepID=A0A915ETD0_9BILA
MVESTNGKKPPNNNLLIVGNVSSTTVEEEIPPNGMLIFDANFESGNLGRVDVLGPNEYDLFIRPDTCNPKHRVEVVFNIVNFSKLRTLFDSGAAAPVFKTDADKVWSNRISAKHIYYYRSQPHGDRFILSFVHVFQTKNEHSEFAYCIPYTYSQLQNFLIGLEALNLPYFKKESLTLSVQKRRCIPEKALQVLYYKALSNFWLDQIPEPNSFDPCTPSKLFQCSTLMCLFRKLQMLSYGLRPEQTMAKSIYMGTSDHQCCQKSSHTFQQQSTVELSLCIDLHAHSQQTNSFFYGNMPVNTCFGKNLDRQLYIPHLLAQSTDDYSLQLTQFNTDYIQELDYKRYKGGQGAVGVASFSDGRVAGCQLPVLHSRSILLSYRPKDNLAAKPVHYLENSYKLLGENLCIAVLNYSQILSAQREIEIQRSFETFLSRRCINSFKQMGGKSNSTRSLSQIVTSSRGNSSRSTPTK